MAFSEFETATHFGTIERVFWSRRRPPLHLRDKLREGQRIEGQSIVLFMVRPQYNDPSRTIESPIAKLTFVRTTRKWRLYWQRANLKWYGYEPAPEFKRLEDALEVIHADQYCCFFG